MSHSIDTFWVPVGAFVLVAGFAGTLIVQHVVDERRHAPVVVEEDRAVSAAAPGRPFGARIVANRNGHRWCASSDGLGAAGGDLRPWLDTDPSGGEALWLPGMNSKACRAVLTTLTRQQATAFAAAVDRAKPWPSGTYNCPADDGSSVTVFLSYAGRRGAEVVREALAGCGGISAPGRTTLEGGGLDDLGAEPRGLRGGRVSEAVDE